MFRLQYYWLAFSFSFPATFGPGGLHSVHSEGSGTRVLGLGSLGVLGLRLRF